MNPGKSVLIVTQSDTLRRGLQALLLSIGHVRHIEVTDGPEAALRWASRHQPELLLIDAHIPGDALWLLLRQIRQISPATCRLVLADDVQQQTAIVEPAAEEVLLKGVAPAELVTAIEKLLLTSQGSTVNNPDERRTRSHE